MTANRKPTKQDDPAQSRAFIEKARDIEADDQKSAADAVMGKLAKSPPDPKSKISVRKTAREKLAK